MGLGETVIFAGAIDNPARILGVFDIFALSSDTEQMPVSVLEAMAAGLPVASVDVGDVRDMVSPENQAFVVEREPAALAGAMRALLADDDARSRIGAANRVWARKRYTLDGMVQAYTELYASVVPTAP
jgi:glycosyltransferase involved in cell wall biosynthesis